MYSLNQIPSETQIKKYLRRIIFGKNILCPRCRSRSIFKSEDRYFCRTRRVHFSLLSYTWLAGMKLPLQKFWLLLWCWTQRISVQQAMALTHLSEDAVRRWYDLFRARLPEKYVILERIVQLDEAYGKGWALVMAKQKSTRKIAWTVLSEKSVQSAIMLFIFSNKNVRPRTKLCTDGAQIYNGIERWWPVRHETDIHKKFEFRKTSEIEGMFGNLRTFIRRIYHHVSAEKMPEYAREFSIRFSSPELFENPHTYL